VAPICCCRFVARFITAPSDPDSGIDLTDGPIQTQPLPKQHDPQCLDSPSRAQRWRDAVSELLALQAEYANWSTALPDSLRDSTTAEALEAIAGLDLNDLANIEPPRGYGRD